MRINIITAKQTHNKVLKKVLVLYKKIYKKVILEEVKRVRCRFPFSLFGQSHVVSISIPLIAARTQKRGLGRKPLYLMERVNELDRVVCFG
jgi:hypothetical protein